MIVYERIGQGSPEWHEIRYGKVGGSSLKDLMVDKDITECAIYSDILSAQFEPYIEEFSFKSDAMQRGSDLEPVARTTYSLLNDVDVTQIGWAEMDNNIAGVSPDGLIGSDGGVEFKCPSRKQHMLYILNTETLISDYFWQIVMYFVVFDNIEWVDICSFRPECSYMPLLQVRVIKDTEVRINSKKTLKISDAIEQAKKRIDLLKIEITNFKNKKNESNNCN